MMKNFERIILIITLVIVFLVSVADLFGLLDQYAWFAKRIPTITLLLLTVVIGYWISEQNKERDQLDKIEKLTSVSGVSVRALKTTEEAMDYLSQRFTDAKYSIDQVATAPSLADRAYLKYDQTLTRVLKKNIIKYRHIVMLDVTRWPRVKSFLLNNDIKKYFVHYYDAQQGGIPGFSYAVIDESEIVMRYPYSPEQSELWLSIKHPEVVRLFVAYAKNLWDDGKPLESNNTAQIDDFDKRFSTP